MQANDKDQKSYETCEPVILNVVHLEFLVVHRVFPKSLIKRSLTFVQYSFN